MAILEIVTLENAILRRKAHPVTRFDANLQNLINNMIETLRATGSGVGLAAPQVNIPFRVAIIETPPQTDEEGNDIENSRELYVIANPKIVRRSREMVNDLESCLCIPSYVGEVSRHGSIRVRAQNRRGKQITLRLTGFTACIFQHEIDHLNGILYIDKLTAPDKFWSSSNEGDEESMVGI